MDQIKYQLNSLHLTYITTADLDVGYQVHLKTKCGIDYTTIATAENPQNDGIHENWKWHAKEENKMQYA